ncbi:HlyD family secretion protein [Neisseria sp. HSC-16F19]|nr:HlyD family efflux transporter periplasmic adaptor subunit [Neisseria sp. HSC-16F19]MCP2040734.1 HlyD family secretion protein [Neisseria sp. HSC-16F19]
MKKTPILVMLAVAVAAAAAFVYYRQQQAALPDYLAHSNGRLELKRLDIASLYPGRVAAVHVDEGADVAAGDVLAELSSDTSTSQLAAAQAQKQRAEETVARADAEIRAHQQQLKVAELEWRNAVQLKRDDLVSAAEVQKRRAAFDSANAAVQAARAARAEAAAAVAATQAQIHQAASANDDMTIRSPIAGRVEYRMAEVGSVIAAGSKVVSLLDPADVSMHIFLPNGVVSRLKVGDEARIVLDGIDTVFPATVSFIATDAQFTPKAVETADERAKLMFKVRLKVPAAVAMEHRGLLKGGMTGNGYVRTDSSREWPRELALKQ